MKYFARHQWEPKQLGLNEPKFQRMEQCSEVSQWWPVIFFLWGHFQSRPQMISLSPGRESVLWERKTSKLLAFIQNWNDKMKTWGILNTQPVFPEGKHLEFWWWSGEWGTRPKTSRRQKKNPTISQCSGIKDLPGEENCLKYMIPHSLKTFVNFKVIQVRKIKKKIKLKTTGGKSWVFF